MQVTEYPIAYPTCAHNSPKQRVQSNFILVPIEKKLDLGGLFSDQTALVRQKPVVRVGPGLTTLELQLAR
jgi:hypothetical protein